MVNGETLARRVFMILCKILNVIVFVQDNNTGQALLDVVFRHLDLLETAYFGLRYVDQDNQTVSMFSVIMFIESRILFNMI